MPEVLMPRLSDTMTEGVIGQWLKHEGDIVERGDTLAEIETDNATMELEAYDSGVLTRIIAPAGSTVPIGQPIAVIDGQAATADAELAVGKRFPPRRPMALRPRSTHPRPSRHPPKPLRPRRQRRRRRCAPLHSYAS